MKGILIVICGLLLQSTIAQTDLITFESKAGFTSNTLNIANVPESRLAFSLPGLSSIHFDASSSLSAAQMISETDGIKSWDVPLLLSHLKASNGLEMDARINLLQFGFHINTTGYITAGLRHHIVSIANFSDEFLNFLGRGNAAYVNQQISFSEEQLGLLQYHDLHLGYTHYIGNLQIGARAKYLRGLNHFEINNWNASIFTDENSIPAYELTATADFNALAGGGVAIIVDSTNTDEFNTEYAFGTGSGFGLDIGAEFKLNNQITISGAVNNIFSQINWKEDHARDMRLVGESSIEFSGFDLSPGDDEADLDTQIEDFEEEIESEFDFSTTKTSYSISIGPEIFLAGTYNFENGKHKLSAIYHGITRFSKYKNNLGVVYHYSPFKYIQLSAAYSWKQASPSNLGLGTTIQFGPVQLHIFTNDLLSMTDVFNAHRASVNVGINFAFGERPVKPEREEVPKNENLFGPDR